MASWREVFEELVRERRAGLVGYAALLTGNVTDGEDLVHDAIIRTFGRVRPFTHVNAAEAYVRQAISSAFIDGTRRQSRWRRVAPLGRPAGAAICGPRKCRQPSEVGPRGVSDSAASE